jgi:hypothetical protein
MYAVSLANSFGMIQLLLIAIEAHIRLEQDPLDPSKHPRLRTNLGQVAAMFGFLQRGQPELGPVITRALALWPEPLRDSALRAAADPEGFWNQETWAEAWNCLEENLIDRPFGDLGPRRLVSWWGLGIQWSASFLNTYVATPAAEQFIAQFQLALCSLAQEDVALAPTQVTFDIDVRQRKSLKLTHAPSPRGGLIFSLSLPSYSDAPDDWKYALTAIATILRFCSLLSEEKFRAVFEHAMPDVPEQMFIARPYSELYREFVPPQLFLQEIRRSSAPFQDGMPFKLKEVSELAWTDGLGPTYSEREALESVRLRYIRLLNCVGVTARRLAQDTSTRGVLLGMHNRGIKDWEILSIIGNIAMNLRLGFTETEEIDDELIARGKAACEITETVQTALDPSAFTPELFASHETAFLAAHMDAWQLRPLAGFFDQAAFEQFMTVRYRMREDDLPHEDIFGW